MRTTFSPEERSLIIAIAREKLRELDSLQADSQLLNEKLQETQQRGFTEATIMDYYSTIAERWAEWERIIADPDSFLDHRHPHQYLFIIDTINEKFAHHPQSKNLRAKIYLVHSMSEKLTMN